MTAVRAGEILTHDLGLGGIRIGIFLHTVVTTNGTSVLHTKYWLAKEPRVIRRHNVRVVSGGFFKRLFKSVYESVLGYAKGWIVNEEVVRGVFVHTKEKMFVLGRLLEKLNPVQNSDEAMCTDCGERAAMHSFT